MAEGEPPERAPKSIARTRSTGNLIVGRLAFLEGTAEEAPTAEGLDTSGAGRHRGAVGPGTSAVSS